ncbi:MAG: site-specific DNA-methyltransferase [Bellilinea sp.]|nr:site-specific DNA-methyltransferase [Bellilinea sp.]
MNDNHSLESRLNQIIQADCLKELAAFPAESVDLSLFSPPYDDIRDYKKNWRFDFETLGKELFRVTKEGGVAVVVIGDATRNFAKTLTSFRLAVNWVDQIGWKLFETVIYKRDGNPGAWWNTRFRVDHEYVFIFFKGQKPKTFHKEHLMVPSKHAGKIYTGTDRLTNGGFKGIQPKAVNPLKCRGTVWQYATSNTEGNRLKLQHPATFPDKLAEDLILCFSNPGDIVLDPMCGSGTTCVMARKNYRNFIGIEISEEYCEIARKRLEVEVYPQQERLF